MNRLQICAALFAALMTAPVFAAGEPKDPELQRVSGQLAQLEADPSLGSLGAVDRFKAHQAIAELAQTAPHSRDRAQALYTAERRVAAAQFAAQADLAERQLEQLDREHDRILLEASRRDADQARQEAERLRLQNTARDEEAQRAQAEQQAQNEQAAGIASNESDQAHALAEARAKEAVLAQQEAALAAGLATGAAPPKPPPAPAREPRGPSMVLSGASFVPGKASLRTDAPTKARIKAIVAFVQANSGARLRVEGHTDNQGNPQANLSLSQQRADAIKDELRAVGIPASRVQAVGLGGEQPMAPNATPQGRERNRRVEVIVLRNKN